MYLEYSLLDELDSIPYYCYDPYESFDILYKFRDRVYWERAKHLRYRRKLKIVSSIKRSNCIVKWPVDL